MARAVIGEDLPGVEDDDIEDWEEFLDALKANVNPMAETKGET